MLQEGALSHQIFVITSRSSTSEKSPAFQILNPGYEVVTEKTGLPQFPQKCLSRLLPLSAVSLYIFVSPFERRAPSSVLIILKDAPPPQAFDNSHSNKQLSDPASHRSSLR